MHHKNLLLLLLLLLLFIIIIISSTSAWLPQLGVSASGVNMVTIPHSGTCQKDLVHSVNTLCSVQSEDNLFTVSNNASLSVTDLPATCIHSVNTSHSVQASNDDAGECCSFI